MRVFQLSFSFPARNLYSDLNEPFAWLLIYLRQIQFSHLSPNYYSRIRDPESEKKVLKKDKRESDIFSCPKRITSFLFAILSIC